MNEYSHTLTKFEVLNAIIRRLELESLGNLTYGRTRPWEKFKRENFTI